MEINWVDPESEPDWHPPFISSESLDDHVRDASHNGPLYFRAKFTNVWDDPLNISQGSVLFQICAAPSNNKIIGFGGLKYAGPQIWQPGVEVTMVYTCDSATWSNIGELEDVYPVGVDKVPLLGSAAFTSDKEPEVDDYFSSAILMDGLLVYKIS
jgi:hypothetical protein